MQVVSIYCSKRIINSIVECLLPKSLCFIFFFFIKSICVEAQFPDSVATGYLLDAAEEYWPVQKDSTRYATGVNKLKHLAVNKSRGYNSIGVHLREGYEYFNDYLWGIGAQDKNGFLLHRILLHDDFRWNQHLRIFAEAQSSTITGRNGGPRPVQDENILAVIQLFGELSIPAGSKNRLRFRFGKQALHYGSGTLLDIRDANVRRSFYGSKLILENKSTRVDAFYMKLVRTEPRFFDDEVDHDQKIAGIWATKNYASHIISKWDGYYIYIHREQSRYNQGVGNERRHTVGMGITLNWRNWYSYSEADIQSGTFNNHNINAWKIAASIGYKFHNRKLKPVLSLQGAVSSGDKSNHDQDLQTFNPIYPKAIYYGFIDNVGSANIILVHPKLELQWDDVKCTINYYKFWRQSIQDGLYAVNGSFLLPADNAAKQLGQMFDVNMVYNESRHWSLQFTGAYYYRDKFLREKSITQSNIFYIGCRANIRI